MSKKPVRKLEDLKGLKIRAFGGVGSDFLQMLGAVPVAVQSAETYTSLQSGVVDACFYSDGSSVTYKLYEVAKYHTNLGISLASVPYAMNPKFFDGLSPENKKYIYNKLRQASQMSSHAYDIDDIAAVKVLKANGVEMIELSESEIQRFRTAVEPVWEKFIKENEAKGFPARQLVEDFRKLNAQYRDLTPEQAMEMVTKNPIPGIVNF